MSQALYRKYRSKSFSEIIGQDAITKTLQEAIKSGRISHAYLLSGPKGVGKTSVARILAHEVNNLPYRGESIHLDIIEIDAASNRRIDEIRDIREKVHIAPTSAKYKVYIIDEVHMLTKEAFNALLKTLEEPPTHCIFILATTEAHKLPETIISRTQHFNFKLAEQDVVTKHLNNIAKKEKIDIEPAALELLAQHSAGSIRDAISMLDQLSGTKGPISEQDARELLGLPPSQLLGRLIADIEARDSKHALLLLDQLRSEGASPVLVAQQLGMIIREMILNGESLSFNRATGLLKSLLDVSSAAQPFEILEISILEACMDSSQNEPVQRPTTHAAASIKANPTVTEAPVIQPSGASTGAKDTSKVDFSLELWPEVLASIKTRAASIYTALRLASPEFNDSTLTLSFQFPLHKNKLAQSRHIQLIEDVIEELSGTRVIVRCAVADKAPLQSTAPDTTIAGAAGRKSNELATISNIFGSAEMLE